MITMNLGVTNTIEIVSAAGVKEMLPGASVLEIGPDKIQAKIQRRPVQMRACHSN